MFLLTSLIFRDGSFAKIKPIVWFGIRGKENATLKLSKTPLLNVHFIIRTFVLFQYTTYFCLPCKLTTLIEKKRTKWMFRSLRLNFISCNDRKKQKFAETGANFSHQPYLAGNNIASITAETHVFTVYCSVFTRSHCR